jgi:hypothetical protein
MKAARGLALELNSDSVQVTGVREHQLALGVGEIADRIEPIAARTSSAVLATSIRAMKRSMAAMLPSPLRALSRPFIA